MFLGKVFRKVLLGAALIIGFSGLQNAMADSIHDWDGSAAVFDDDSAEAQGVSPDNLPMRETIEHEVLEEVKFTQNDKIGIELNIKLWRRHKVLTL